MTELTQAHRERALELSHRLFAIRAQVRERHGARYQAMLSPYLELIQAVAKAEAASVLTVGQHMAKALLDEGRPADLVLAATVELINPTGVGRG